MPNKDSENAEKFRETVSTLFNKVTFENALKWKIHHYISGKNDYIASALDWLKEESLPVRGHCLIWPGWRKVPRDLYKHKHEPEKLRKELGNHIREFSAKWKDDFIEWDVINEALSHNDFEDIFGKEIL
ncbi:endo-1,4-beta-xylanase, partial [Verrucomicrobiota bacterium]